MTLESFLSFWNHHNTTIIEALIALITVSSLFLGFRHFFVKESHSDLGAGGVTGDISQLENTLKKILENQASAPPPAAAPAPPPEPAAPSDPGGELMFTAADLQHFRDSLAEALTKNEELQTKITTLEKSGGAAAAPAGNPALEAELKSKVADLEARLKEYELISDDIAELSRFREENSKLKKEIAKLSSGASTAVPEVAEPPSTPSAKSSFAIETEPVAEAVAVPVPEPIVSEPPVVEAPPAEPEVVAAVPAPEVAPVADDAPTMAISAEGATTEAPVEAESGPNPLDEEFLKEFAEVVHGKKPEDKAVAGAPSTPSPPKDGASAEADETQKLMNSFESFVANKKE